MVTTDVLSTIQFETSDPHVLIRLSVLDEEKEVVGKNGKGFVVLPVFFFLASKGQHTSGTLALKYFLLKTFALCKRFEIYECKIFM